MEVSILVLMDLSFLQKKSHRYETDEKKVSILVLMDLSFLHPSLMIRTIY